MANTASVSEPAPARFDFLVIVIFALALRLLVATVCTLEFDFEKYPHETWLGLWDRWDAKHYEYIAENFYARGTKSEEDHRFLSRFPPLYPIFMGAVIRLTFLPTPVAGIVISLACLIAASWLFFRLLLFEWGDRSAALRGVVLLNVFPSAYFSQAPFSEALFLLLIVSVFFSIRVRQNIGAGWIFVGLALFTRIVGILAALPVFIATLRKLRTKPLGSSDWLPSVVPVAMITHFLIINLHYYRDPFAFLLLQDASKENSHIVRPSFAPFQELSVSLRHLAFEPIQAFQDHFFMMTQGWGAILFLSVALVLLAGVRFLPLEYQAFSWAYLLFLSNLKWAVSLPRYLWLTIPVYMVLAKIRWPIIFWSVAALAFVLQLYLAREFSRGTMGY